MGIEDSRRCGGVFDACQVPGLGAGAAQQLGDDRLVPVQKIARHFIMFGVFIGDDESTVSGSSRIQRPLPRKRFSITAKKDSPWDH